MNTNITNFTPKHENIYNLKAEKSSNYFILKQYFYDFL